MEVGGGFVEELCERGSGILGGLERGVVGMKHEDSGHATNRNAVRPYDYFVKRLLFRFPDSFIYDWLIIGRLAGEEKARPACLPQPHQDFSADQLRGCATTPQRLRCESVSHKSRIDIKLDAIISLRCLEVVLSN